MASRDLERLRQVPGTSVSNIAPVSSADMAAAIGVGVLALLNLFVILLFVQTNMGPI